MGVKDLWSVLTPHAERKPICELRGQRVAIDLAGWVCESLNVVDYFVHPRHHLKNLFFRTCYLIWEEVTPVFILEGAAPKLKSRVIEARNEIQFRGVKPKESQSDSHKVKSNNCRTRFNHVLKQCEDLLHAMGMQCMQGPGEAEAFCAFLNANGLVDGVISQDSDCFAYGALRVYRNFSVSSQGALAAQGGAVDIYDMQNICSKMDFGQNKAVVMALLCGCDYCPEGIGGVGRDSVLKLFNKYKNEEILERIRSWRAEDMKYSTLEMRVDDKTICSNCGHMGRTQNHTKNGCGICRTDHGCDESLWRNQRLSIKAELSLRKKALTDPCFPSEEIIEEFFKQPREIPRLKFHWRQPNVVKFITQMGPLLQWSEIYSFQKCFPIFTRWQILNGNHLQNLSSSENYVTLKKIVKKRYVKGVPSLEVLWEDEKGIFTGLIPDSQLKELSDNNPKGLQDIWTTVEPFDKVKTAYPSLVESFLISQQKPKKVIKKPKKAKTKSIETQTLGSLENLNDINNVIKEIATSLKPKRKAKNKKSESKNGIQTITHFFKQNHGNAIEKNTQTPTKSAYQSAIEAKQCSTPITKNIPSDLESDIDPDVFDMSDIVNDIVSRSRKSFNLSSHNGKQLCYETITQNTSISSSAGNKDVFNDTNRSIDDFYISNEKRSLSNCSFKPEYSNAKRMSLDDSFDVLVKKGICNNLKFTKLKETSRLSNIVDRFKQKECISEKISNSLSEKNDLKENSVSYFFNNSFQLESEDAFEMIMETSICKQ